MRKVLFAASLLMALASPALATQASAGKINVPKGTEVFMCRFPQAHGSLPRQVDIAHLPSGVWLARDPFQRKYHLPVQRARITTNTPQRITLGWDIENQTNRDTNHFAPKILFRLTLQKATREASLDIQPIGYRNEFTTGDCDPPHQL